MFTNKCEQTIWPGILSNAGVAPLDITGFSLERGESKTISAPSSWGGRLWGRTQCTEDSAGQFSCVTGDCGSGKEECAGGNAAPPATLAEFTLDGSGGMDFYDVSLVDGYNLPMLVVPQGGSGANCSATGCRVDVNGLCPSALKVTSSEGDMVACKSACEAFGDPEYCCSGAFGTPDACKPSSYSMMFKGACPSAYSYAYDDRTSTFTCSGAPDYVITFCPSPNTSQKSSAIADSGGVEEQAAGMDNSMVYDGALDVSGGVHPMGSSHVFSSDAIVGAMAIIATMYVITQS
ncbi:unnamed protein product [Cuscuta epithymum]|nr:unnamed protein product [Cuscuta epithymum]